MRRIKLVLAALSVAVASFAAFSGPVLADDLDCHDARGDLIRCNGDLYAPYYNHDNYDYLDHYFNDDFYFFNPYLFFSPYNYYDGFDDYSYGCEGPVCLID